LLPDLSEASARRVAAEIQAVKRPGDIALLSIHWGANWGYEVPQSQVRFAHRLIEEGADLICGHSSHHVKALEVYRNRLVIYGAGDFINDYEGIGGYEEFRGDLALMYLPKLDARTGELAELRLVPMQMKRFRLNRAAPADAQWLCDLLNRQGTHFATAFQLRDDAAITVEAT
ncbi:MAG: poly-gamma-glutamate biosynthesis protein, partial [Planctomycetes bacterium]|nr:poly-gamma-glutamate biosynthesis protein [Planctomycetota bacterium]